VLLLPSGRIRQVLGQPAEVAIPAVIVTAKKPSKAAAERRTLRSSSPAQCEAATRPGKKEPHEAPAPWGSKLEGLRSLPHLTEDRPVTKRDKLWAVYSLYEEVSMGTDRRVWLCYKQDWPDPTAAEALLARRDAPDARWHG